MEEIMIKITEELNMTDVGGRLLKTGKDKKKEKKYLEQLFPIDESSVEENVVRPFKYLMTQHGKNVRQKLISSINYWLGVRQEVVDVLYKVMFLIQNSALMVDDIQDKSVLRRGIPCTHLVFGVANTMNSVNYMAAQMTEILSSLKNQKVIRIFQSLLADSIRGQTQDIYWREHNICPTENEYKLMISRKTGAPFLFTLRILACYTKEEDIISILIRLTTSLGLYFQTNDDFISLWSEEYQKTKGFCEDITEGKFSFPIIYVINNFPEEGKIVKDILSQRTRDLEVLRYCRSILEKCGAKEHTRKAIIKYKNRLLEEKSKLKPNPLFEDLLQTSFLIPETAVVI